MRAINKIILHCSATPPKMDIGANEIRGWHVDDNGWSDIGYHYVIRRNGEIETGRPLDIAGSHTYRHNANSIGICLIGGINDKGKSENNFTQAQMATVERLVRILKADYPKATVYGHREFAPKDCPSFDVQEWLKDRGM